MGEILVSQMSPPTGVGDPQGVKQGAVIASASEAISSRFESPPPEIATSPSAPRNDEFSFVLG